MDYDRHGRRLEEKSGDSLFEVLHMICGMLVYSTFRKNMYRLWIGWVRESNTFIESQLKKAIKAR